jgi:hypothetical protein
VDLYVANYLSFDAESIPRRGTEECLYMGRLEVFCGPLTLTGEADALFRSRGDGTFEDVTLEAGIDDPGRYGFGVVFSDFDNDGWLDIYVANDSVPNFMFRNNRDGTFEETGLISGTGLNLSGYAQAGMGIALGDYDADGDLDIFVTNFAQDTNTLYQNLGGGFFLDATASARVGEPSRPHLGWGTGFADLDNDGWLDLFVSNGHVYPGIDALDVGSSYLQPKEVYRNLGDGSFEELTPSLEGSDLLTPRSARGAVFGDYDDDGDIDVIAINLNAPPDIYRNDGGNRNHWIGFRLEGEGGNRDAIGSRIEIEAGGRTQIREVRSGGSYLSHNDMRLHFGLGEIGTVDSIRVRWADGTAETVSVTGSDRYVTIRQGSGIVSTGP